MIDCPDGDPKTWQVGVCKVTRVIEMETIGGATWIMPGATKELAKSVEWLVPSFADERGRMKFAIQLLVVDAPGGVRIAVDTCVGNHKRRPLEHWNMRTGPFLEHLRAAGIPPESVTHVFCTHLHTDHIGWNTRWEGGRWVPTFPSARYLFGRREYEYWSQGGRAGDGGSEGDLEEELADSITPVLEAGLVELVDLHHVLLDAGDTRLYLRPTLGHTPGHASLMIESRGAKAIITGDCFHHPLQFTEVACSSRADVDPAQATRTREALLEEFCDTPTLVFGTHFARPTVGAVRRHKRRSFMLDTAAAVAFEAADRAKL